MANSRSNIYPVQLQGAELNLNKFDAEIKQYSGFNKNNSPFVGGCLSNVFTKEEQISGGNADNTYIDSNGDVYRVDHEGLWKNNNKIIPYPDTVKFYKKRKVSMPSNVVKALNESVYITREDDIEFSDNHHASGYMAHWGNGYTAIIGEEYTMKQSYLNISAKDNSVVFSYKRYIPGVDDNGNSVDAHFIICPDINNALYKEVSKDTSSFGSMALFLQGDPAPASQSAYIINSEEYVLALNEEYSHGIRVSMNPYLVAFVHYEDGNFIVERFSNTAFNIEGGGNIVDKGNNGYIFYPSLYLSDWYMTNEGLFYYKKTRNYVNKVTGEVIDSNEVFDFSSYKNSHSNFETVLLIKPTVNSTGILVDASKIVMSGTSFGINSNSGTVNAATFRAMKGVFTPDYVFYTGLFYLGYTSGPWRATEFFFSLSGTFSNSSFSGSAEGEGVNKHTILKEITTGGVICKDNFKILINNNNVSGVSIADFYFDDYVAYHREGKSFNGVLVEEWNTIEDFNIFDNKLFYSKNGAYYCVEEGDPTLFCVLDQVVCNCNYEENSYDKKRDLILHFAPDWNNSWLTLPRKPYNVEVAKNVLPDFSSRTSPFEDTYFIASAVNEYNLENNASIILNMATCLFDLSFFSGQLYWRDDYNGSTPVSTRTYHKNPSKFIENYIDTGGVNFYIGLISDNKAIYNGTATKAGFINEDLIGLPYPNDANGNIQYSPSIFAEFVHSFGTDVFVIEEDNVYQLMKSGQQNVMSYFLGTLIEGLKLAFILQGQYYGIINNRIFSLQFNNGVVSDTQFIVNVQGLQFVGNTPYEALFFSKTNRCLYSFTGANVLNQKQLVDKISEVRNYLYNPATQTVFLITDIGVLFYGLFGMFLLEYTNISNIFLLDNGIVMSDNSGNYRYIKYYLDEGDEGYTKENIRLETCFYGMNNEVVTINDCLYFRLFSEEHEEGNLKVKATTISLKGRQTEETTFKIKASDWDKITHTIYLRYQPKTQRGLGVSFSIDSPFKIASMSVGSQPDAVLVDRVSKGAITAPSVTTNNNEW